MPCRSTSPFKRNLLIFTAIIMLAVLFWISSEFEESFFKIVSFFEKYAKENEILGIGIFIILNTLSSMLVSFSSIWFVPIATPIFGNVWTIIFLLLGWYLGGIFSYLIGRYAGVPIVTLFVKQEKIDYYRDLIFGSGGSFGLVFLIRLVLPSEIPGFIFGIIKHRFGKYFLATVLGEIPYAIITVYAIVAILKREPLLLIILGGLWLILASVTFHIFYSRIRKRRRSI